jgi:hypothetical protein
MESERLCAWCEEVVEPKDQHPAFCSQPMHLACGFRVVAGSVAHIEKRCGCFVPGSDENDPPKMSKREAAEYALAVWRMAYADQA